MSDFEAMNAAYVEIMGDRRPARTVISVQELPKPGALLTMNLTAVTRSDPDSPDNTGTIEKQKALHQERLCILRLTRATLPART